MSSLRSCVSWVSLLVLVGGAVPLKARASCNVIPLDITQSPSTQGTIDRLIAAPGDTVTVRLDLACDANLVGFDPVLADNEITLRFEPPSAMNTEVAVPAASVSNCSQGPTGRCDTLSFVVPDTDALLAPAADGIGLAGTARILVTGPGGNPLLAEIGPLFEPTLACTALEAEGVFEHFTVLPTPTLFDPAATEILATLDGGDNLLIPFDYSNVLVQDPGSLLFLLLEGTADLDAFTSSPNVPIRVPAKRFLRSYTLEGRRLPPILETNAVGDTLLGSVDARRSVLRISRLDPDNPLDPALYDLTDRFFSSKGPIVISSPTLAAQTHAPLDTLKSSTNVVAFARSESAEGTDLNGDGDTSDQLVQVVDPSEASGTDTMLAVVEVSTADFTGVAIAADGDLTAFLESEAHARVDANGDTDTFDSILRVFEADGTDLTAALDVSADPTPVVNRRPLAVSNGFVFFRTREGDDLPRITERVSVGPGGIQSNDASFTSASQVLTSEGQQVAFWSEATNLLAGPDGNVWRDAFVYDRATDATVRISESSGGVVANGPSVAPATTPDGRFVTFDSTATNLVSGDTNSVGDVFVRDRDTDEDGLLDEPGAVSTVRVSVASDGSQGDQPSLASTVSADGRFVAFSSLATNLVSGDTNNSLDVFVHDRDLDEDGVFDEPGQIKTVRVSVSDLGAEGNGESGGPEFSADGRFVAFLSGATNLVLGDTNGVDDIFVHDRDADEDGIFDEGDPGATTTTRVSVSSTGAEADLQSISLYISGDGRFVGFLSEATNLVPNDTNGVSDSFVHDRQTGTTERVSVGTGGEEADDITAWISLSGEGRFGTFVSTATNLVPGDTNGNFDVFVFDRTTNSIERASVTTAGNEVAGFTWIPSISPDGRVVAFRADDSTLVPGDTNGFEDVFVRGIDLTGATSLNAADSDLQDTVLQLFDPGGLSLRANARVAASELAVAAGRAILLTSEMEEGDTNLNATGGDADADDTVARVYDANTDTLTNLGVAADAIAISSDVVCLSVPEADENATDRNGDADSEDSVLAAWDIGVAPASPTNVGVTARPELAAAGFECIFLSSEAEETTDLNADGDMDDDVIRVYDESDPDPTPANRISEIGQQAVDFVVGGNLVAFRTSEAAQNATMLNGDGDSVDTVMQIWDLGSDTLINTNRAARICDFGGCNPFFEPYRVQGDTVSFITHEADQSGATLGVGCLPTGVPGECDLTGDGDANDLVMQVYNVNSGRAQVFEISETHPPEVPPFPETLVDGTALQLRVPESVLGADVNEDGMIDDTLVTVVMSDADGDGTLDRSLSTDDTCVDDPNPGQIDADSDDLGDTCDSDDASPLPGDLPCDADGDATIDQSDIDIIVQDRGMTARASDARDADGDGLVTLDDADLCVPQCAIACSVPPVCGDGILQAMMGEECDDRNFVNFDSCSTACELEYAFDLSGTGTMAAVHSITIDGVTLMVATGMGDTAADLAAAIADAINDDATLASMGVVAQATGDRLVTNGDVTGFVLNDPGFTLSQPECGDGLDNDGDTFVDLDDADCENTFGPSEGVLVGNVSLALDFTGGIASAPFGDTVGGWEFGVSESLEVISLGVWDEGADGLANAHEVGLYTIGQQLLASATVPPGGSVSSTSMDGEWIFIDIDPVALDPGVYVVAATYLDSDADLPRFFATATTVPEIAFVTSRFVGSSTLVFPITTSPSNDDGYFGPNIRVRALAVAIPSLPAYGLAVLMIALAGLGALISRRRSSNG